MYIIWHGCPCWMVVRLCSMRMTCYRFIPFKSQEEYHHLQDDILTIEDWVNSNYLTLNPTKCKYNYGCVTNEVSIHLSRISLMLAGTEMEKVDCFKYLGLLLSSDVSFSKHIESISSKARKITGLLYRRFNSANSDTLLQLYLTMVRLHLEYASPVWNPSTRHCLTETQFYQ